MENIHSLPFFPLLVVQVQIHGKSPAAQGIGDIGPAHLLQGLAPLHGFLRLYRMPVIHELLDT